MDDGILLNFPNGLIGFPELTRLRLLEPADAYPLKFLQSDERPEIGFVALDVVAIRPDYKVPMSEEEAQSLALEREEDAMVITLVVIPPEDPKAMTTNLAGPLVINSRTRTARQIALAGDAYPLKHRILSPS